MTTQNFKHKPEKGKRSASPTPRRDSKNGKFTHSPRARAKIAVKPAGNDRYEMRIDSTRRANWERAKALAGFSTLKDYLTYLADQDAKKVIDKHDTMTLKNDVFDMFIEACESSSKPNDKLLAAAKHTKEQDF